MRGLTAHCPHLSLEGNPSGGARQGLLIGEIVETDDVRESVVVHTYALTGRRTRLAKSRVWKPVFNHDLSKKSVPMDPISNPNNDREDATLLQLCVDLTILDIR